MSSVALWECRECGSPNVRSTRNGNHRPRRQGAGVFRFRKCSDCGTMLRTVEVAILDAAPIFPRFSAN